MAGTHLRRLAGTYIFRARAGAQGRVKAARTLNSSCPAPSDPGIHWLRDRPSWMPSLPPTQFDAMPRSAHGKRGWGGPRSSRHNCMKMINHGEVSVPKAAATDSKAPPKKALDGAKFSVVRVDDDGTWHPLSLRISELEIHPRDVDVLTRSASFVPQRATISVRSDKVIVRMENVRALVCADHALLFEARRPPIGRVGGVGGVVGSLHGKSSAVNEVMDRAREFFAISMAEQVKNPSGCTYEVMPFHLKMVECLLEETSSFFNQKVERLKVLVERVLEELTSDVNMGGLQRLLPLKRALTELEHDIQDAHGAMEQVLSSDENLQALCFQNRTAWPSALNALKENKEEALKNMHLRQAAADMLLTYQREFDDAGGALEELRKDLNAAQEIWELGLDTTRNRIIRTDLMMSMGTLSVSLAASVGAFFGMNLTSGYEDHPSLFWWVTGCATASSVVVAAGLFTLIRIRPQMEDKRRAQDLAGLQNLLQHLDDLDDIFQVVLTEVAGKPVRREEFLRIVRKHPSAEHMTQSELDLMFRLFDVNRNRVLELKEFHMRHGR